MAEFGIGAYQRSIPMPKVESATSSAPKVSESKSQSSASFMDTLKSALDNVNESMKAADKAARDFSTGEAQNLHDVMISMEKADVSLRTLTAVRGKVVEAYQEIMRMPV